jgi:hypothetical protein
MHPRDKCTPGKRREPTKANQNQPKPNHGKQRQNVATAKSGGSDGSLVLQCGEINHASKWAGRLGAAVQGRRRPPPPPPPAGAFDAAAPKAGSPQPRQASAPPR